MSIVRNNWHDAISKSLKDPLMQFWLKVCFQDWSRWLIFLLGYCCLSFCEKDQNNFCKLAYSFPLLQSAPLIESPQSFLWKLPRYRTRCRQPIIFVLVLLVGLKLKFGQRASFGKCHRGQQSPQQLPSLPIFPKPQQCQGKTDPHR